MLNLLSTFIKFDHLEPVHGNLMQEDEVIQLLDVEDDLEEGELPSDIDKAIMDETCSMCSVPGAPTSL